MSEHAVRPVAIPRSLTRLRRRLTIWYAATFLTILLLLGIGLFAVITKRFDAELDASLREAAGLLARSAQAKGAVAAHSLVILDRRLLLVDSAGRAVGQDSVDAWLSSVASRAAAAHGPVSAAHEANGRILRAFAQPFRGRDGRAYVAMSIADEVELEDRYASLIAAFGVAALLSLLLVIGGGWLVARQSTLPVEQSIDHMRRFMADAAHELRTPITVVRSRAEVALQRPRDAAAYEEALRGIERESARVGHIVEDLLTLARADAGERPIERHRVFLDDIALDAAASARALAERKNVCVEVGEFEESPVDGDAELLRRLALILLDNAVKFTASGGTVMISVDAVADTVSLRIVDRGVGIPSDQLPHVFERFYRGDPSRTRGSDGASEGAGLGLAIAQWIAEEHGGAIRLDSAAGRGTTAIVSLPRAQADSLSSS
jgi:signal transduction histidine kinase